jgi:hypothetical protein
MAKSLKTHKQPNVSADMDMLNSMANTPGVKSEIQLKNLKS